jgi:gliding motility-associated-like protein
MIKRYVISFFLVFFFILSAHASHISGGEVYYSLISQSGNNYTYAITLKLLRDATPGGPQLEPAQTIAIYEKGTNTLVWYDTIVKTYFETITLTRPGSCLINPPQVKYDIALYEVTVTLPGTANGYIITSQRCCRVSGIANIISSSSTSATYMAEIPGNGIVATGSANNSAHFLGIDTVIICGGYPFTYNFGAEDVDSDSLVYSFCDAYNGSSSNPPLPPPYNSLPYASPFSGTIPLGNAVAIDKNTGIITGNAPAAGTYVVTVCVQEWRNGELIATQRKDLQVKVADCDFAEVTLNTGGYINCTDYNFSFNNLTPSSAISSYFWDFGVTNTTADTSIASTPSYTYPDTGVYNLKVIVNRYQPCADTAWAVVKVFPGFAADFSFTGSCIYSPLQFSDLTTTAYGSINYWQWDFGIIPSDNDTSNMQDPQYSYGSPGNYNVQFIVANSKGCRDTVSKTVTTIDKPLLNLSFRDTLICSIDTLQLHATGTGVVSWTPGYNMIGASSATPFVFPKTTMSYKIVLNDNGCINQDSVRVRVVDLVTISAGKDTTICTNDNMQLNASTNGLHYNWSSSSTLNNLDILNPVATPSTTTTYQIISVIGGCTATDDITIKVMPRPFVNAGNDTAICYSSSVLLTAQSNGTSFNWSPASSLNNASSLTPLATPLATTRYILTATDNISGCSKPSFDSVTITVFPRATAITGRDTIIFAGQQLQLSATGGTTYLWTPATGLSDPTIPDPTVLLYGNPDSILYTISVTNQYGCTDTAGIVVKVYKTNPDIFVPTGFTPNGDGRNDVFRPIYVGMKTIEYFQVYNRWGALLYSHNLNDGQGWDGTIKGLKQSTGTFIWMVRATDIIGNVHVKKGTVLLIR